MTSIKETDTFKINKYSLMSDESLIIIDEIFNRIYYDTNKSKISALLNLGKKFDFNRRSCIHLP